MEKGATISKMSEQKCFSELEDYFVIAVYNKHIKCKVKLQKNGSVRNCKIVCQDTGRPSLNLTHAKSKQTVPV